MTGSFFAVALFFVGLPRTRACDLARCFTDGTRILTQL